MGYTKTEVIDYFKHEWEGINDVALATLLIGYTGTTMSDYILEMDICRLLMRRIFTYCSLKPSGYAV